MEGATLSLWKALVKPLKLAVQEPCTLKLGLSASGATISSYLSTNMIMCKDRTLF